MRNSFFMKPKSYSERRPVPIYLAVLPDAPMVKTLLNVPPKLPSGLNCKIPVIDEPEILTGVSFLIIPAFRNAVQWSLSFWSWFNVISQVLLSVYAQLGFKLCFPSGAAGKNGILLKGFVSLEETV